jgi:hypothetical protein
VIIVGIDATAVETDLIGGRLGCPSCGSAASTLGPRHRTRGAPVPPSERRRLRRSICRSCDATHMLVPEDTLVRRRDGVEVIGAALTAKARGDGHRRIAAELGRRPSTVRGWLSRFAEKAVALREHFTRWAHALDPGHDRRSSGGSEFFRRGGVRRRARGRGGPPLRSPPAVVACLGGHRRGASLQHELALP